MAKSCAIIPKIKDNKGNLVRSKLFTDLLAYTGNNRKETSRIYLITKNDDFIRDWIPKLQLDHLNEPTVASLLKETNLGSIISEEKVLKKLNTDIGYYKKNQNRAALNINNNSNYQKLLKKAIDFNKNSEYKDSYVADVIQIQDTESSGIYIGVKIFKRDKMHSINASNMEYNYNLNVKLRSILKSKGVSIGALNDLEKRMQVNGVTDFSVAEKTANGLIEMIRLDDGELGEKALPEEFSHFAIEALGDSPLVNRLLTVLRNNNLVKEILGDEYDAYVMFYKGDETKLAKEAAGKLLAKHLLKQEEIPNKPYKTLLGRLISAVKSFFKSWKASDIQRAKAEANVHSGKLASDILNGRTDRELDIKNIGTSDEFYQVKDRIKRDKKLLKSILNNELKRLKIYEKRNPDSKFSNNQHNLIDTLSIKLDAGKDIEGIYIFLDRALDELQKVSSKLSALKSDDKGMSLNEKSIILRNVRNYIYSYKNITNDIRVALLDEEKYEDNKYGAKVKNILDSVTILISNLNINYETAAKPVFMEFLRPFMGNSIVVPFGKYKGKVMKLETLIEEADNDISFFDMFLDSMADSSDHMLRALGSIVNQSKDKARLNTIDTKKELEALTIELEQAGVKDTEWMFERDSNGRLTGNYISEINYSIYREERHKMYEALEAKYGKNPVGKEASLYSEERREWYKNNMETIDGEKIPLKSKYGNDSFKNLSPVKKKYYDAIMEIKAHLDSQLPAKAIKLHNAVKIRKDLIERVKGSEGVKSGASQVWESVKDSFIRRTDDVGFSDRNTVTDFEGNEVQSLPIYFTNLKKGEDPNDISTDIVSTLTSYASMAYDYNEMNRIIDTLELGRDILKKREIIQTKGDKPLIEKFKILEKKVRYKFTKSGEGTNFVDRLNSFFEMQIYSKYMKDEGTFGKTNIDKAKVANFVNSATALNSLAVNALSGISNIATGKVMMRIESFSGEFFNESNTIRADREYAAHLPEFLGSIGNRVKTNKLALWDEKFNVLQDYEESVRELNFDRKTWFSKMMNTSTLFVMNNAGEHWMQNRTSLALADTYKMKSPEGKIVSLWDAMEVVYLNPKNKKLGATLEVKEGYTKEDGSAFDRKDVTKFSRKAIAINQRMHGIYNSLDKAAIQRLAIGRMGMLFRKWIKPSINRRFKSTAYNFDLESWTEGYYRTSGRFVLNLIKDLRKSQFELGARWDELDDTEKSNIKRALTEVVHFVAISLVLGLLEWPDDKDRSWLIKMAEYQTRRLYTEIGVLIPGKSMITEGLRIIKSPAPGINTMENVLDLTKLLNYYNYTKELESGRFKGHSVAYKAFFESPLVPMNRTIYRGLNPETSIAFFK